MRAKARTPQESLAIGMAAAQEVGDCLEWQGCFSNHGTQPTVKAKLGSKTYSENLSVPRMLWEASNGPVPDGKLVYRRCCNNACVLLEHITIGTRKDWAKARKKAGTSKHSPAAILALTIGARKRSTVKNTMEKAREVRLLASAGLVHAQIAEKTGVHKDMVSDICSNKSWREYSSPFAGLGAR